jgi:NAD(P)-dependent dehydrogenase (short-subunit alcohol dehydrogenase family)
MNDLTGKSAIVTGGSRGIGLAIAEALLARGVDVLATGRSEENLVKAREFLARESRGSTGEQHGVEGRTTRGRLETLVADVRDEGQVQRAVRTAVERFGGLDILVNNAGLGTFRNVADLTLDQWRETIDTNLTGVYNCCHAAIPELRRRGGGWIINVSSLAGKNSFPGAAAYCASKAGLNAFSEALMQEVRYDGIRVSYVMPGSVDTEFSGEAGAGASWKLAAADVAAVVVDLLDHHPRSLPSRVEIRPSQPQKKG